MRLGTVPAATHSKRSAFVGLIVALSVVAGCGSDGSLDADAGDDQTVSVGSSPTFDGCGSSGDIVNYAWVIVDAPPGVDEDEGKVLRETMSDCSFVIDASMEVDEVGPWVVELTVSDADGSTASDTVTVTVEG